VPGHFFNVDRLEATTYTLTLRITYDDGVVVSDSASYDVAALCDIRGPVTPTNPSGQLPQTGSSTSGIVALGAALAAAGGVLVVGSRRRPAG
jgi:LPXTG-motif cell wall-anchored protein